MPFQPSLTSNCFLDGILSKKHNEFIEILCHSHWDLRDSCDELRSEFVSLAFAAARLF